MTHLQLLRNSILLFVLLFVFYNAAAQTYIITYKVHGLDPTIKKVMPFTINRQPAYQYPPDFTIKLLCNDSIGFSAVCDHNRNLLKMFEKVGTKRLSNHTWLSVIRNNRVYKTSFWPAVKKDLIVLDTLWTEHWTDDTASYTLLDYSCKMAYAVSSTGDTAFVYYTNEIPGSFGPLTMWAKAGTMVGVMRNKTLSTLVATSIEKIDYEMKLPPAAMLLARKEYELLVK